MGESNWQEKALGEIVELKRGYDLPKGNRKPGRTPVISSSGISDFHSEAKVKGPGVVTGRYGTIGEVYYISEDFWPLNTALYVKDFKGNDPKFISYLLKTINWAAFSDKAAVPGINRNHVYMAKVRVPPLPEQRRIAHILGTLDDKIELNRRMNATLEAIARAIFKSWFVDFDPVRAKAAGRPSGLPPALDALFPSRFVDSELGEIPEGWEVKALDEIADFLNGLALQKYPPKSTQESLPVIKIREMRQGYSAATDRASSDIDSRYIVEDGDLLFSWSGSLLARFWAEGLGALNQHLFKVTSRYYPEWFYYSWLQHHMPEFQLIAAGKATTMGHIQRHHLSAALCLVPSKELLNEMTNIIQPWIKQEVINSIQMNQLGRVRDLLLPKLMTQQCLLSNGLILRN